MQHWQFERGVEKEQERKQLIFHFLKSETIYSEPDQRQYCFEGNLGQNAF